MRRFSSLKTTFTSPITAASTLTFLLISAGSTSICRILAFLANVLVLPVTRSLKRAPMVIRRSHLVTAKLEVLVPCIPIIPVYSGSVSGNAPCPIRDEVMGASILRTNSVTSAAASDRIAPPPTKIMGFLADLISSSAFSMASEVI